MLTVVLLAERTPQGTQAVLVVLTVGILTVPVAAARADMLGLAVKADGLILQTVLLVLAAAAEVVAVEAVHVLDPT